MKHALLWVRYGFCTCLGLAVIGLAAVTAFEAEPKAPSMQPTDSSPDQDLAILDKLDGSLPVHDSRTEFRR
jgi:hypothetical protein